MSAVAVMAHAGVRWIQVRAKSALDADLERLLLSAAARVREYGGRLWVNDRPDLARIVGADGVHLGQDDLPPGAARRTVGGEAWIGQSTHDLEQLARADADPEVDVIAHGPVYSTTGKARPDPVVGLESVRRARALSSKPLVAIGGIDAENARDVLAAGADTIAVLGAICRGDVAANCRRLLAVTEEFGR